MISALVVGLCITANLMAQVPNYVPTNGLVGWWPFNGNANDESGNGNNGTVNGATLTTDRFGNANNAYNFDGVDDYVIVNNNNNLLIYNDLSVSIWFYTSTNGFYGYLVDRDICGSVSDWSLAYNGSGILRLGNSSGDQLYTTTSLQINTWNNFILSKSNNNINLYSNGILVLTNTSNTTTFSNNNQSIYFGEQACLPQSVNSPNFNGKLDDIGIWNRSLTECEIQDLYNAQVNSVTGTISVSPNPASIGANVTLSNTSNSTNVQWQNNPLNNGWQNVPSNSNYSGGTSNTLTISNVQLSNHNQPFRVIASAGNCTDTSNIATIQIADTCITTIYDTLYTTVTDTLIINTTLSLPAPNNENTILIYPNPASDHITIDNGNYTAMAGYTIKIENNAGQQVFQSLINQAQFYVDLSTWTGNGLYFVHLIDPQNNTVTVRKIVLQ
ncbi:MAG: hypothetical protein RLZ10_1767 [Bacteroidota bacterium]